MKATCTRPGCSGEFKPDNFYGDNGELVCRFFCQTCGTSVFWWQEEFNSVAEVIMGKGRKIICLNCDEVDYHMGRGLCQKCWHEHKKAGTLDEKYPLGTEARPVESEATAGAEPPQPEVFSGLMDDSPVEAAASDESFPEPSPSAECRTTETLVPTYEEWITARALTLAMAMTQVLNTEPVTPDHRRQIAAWAVEIKGHMEAGL